MVVRTAVSAVDTGLWHLGHGINRLGSVFDPVAAALVRSTLWAAGRLADDTLQYESPASRSGWFSTRGGDCMRLAVSPEQDTTIDDTYRVVGMLELGTMLMPMVFLFGSMDLLADGVEAAVGAGASAAVLIVAVVAMIRVGAVHLEHVTVEVEPP